MSNVELGLRSSSLQAGTTDDRPLTDQEYQLLQRLLSDPFSLPIQFKTWLVSYLESSDLSLPMSAVSGLSNMLGLTGIGQGTLGIFPAGIVLPYGSDTAPAGALMCDGASYAKTQQARLYAAIGTRFGSDSADTFKVPDIRGRMLFGVGQNPSVNAVGKNEGLTVNLRRPQHSHTVRDPGHSHQIFYTFGGPGTDSRPLFQTNKEATGTDASMIVPALTNISVGALSSDPLDTSPFITFNFIIIN